MKCPHCGQPDGHVVDSRPVDTASVIRRRRECLSCGQRYTTYERVEAMPLMVIKSDNRREPFDLSKLREGVMRACNKRRVSATQVEQLITDVEARIQEEYVLEVPSRLVGELVLKRLKKLDPMAYIRFASVYKEFSNVDSFLDELRGLKREQKKALQKSVREPVSSLFIGGPLSKN